MVIMMVVVTGRGEWLDFLGLRGTVVGGGFWKVLEFVGLSCLYLFLVLYALLG